jgi:hypothetical protein
MSTRRVALAVLLVVTVAPATSCGTSFDAFMDEYWPLECERRVACGLASEADCPTIPPDEHGCTPGDRRQLDACLESLRAAAPSCDYPIECVDAVQCTG